MIERVWRCTGRPASSELRDTLGGHDRGHLEMPLEAEIARTQRCTWRAGSIVYGDVLQGHDGASLDMNFEVEMLQILRCTWRPWLGEFADALQGCNRMNMEAKIDRVWRNTWPLWLSEFGEALGGYDWVSLEMHLEVRIKQDWMSLWRRSISSATMLVLVRNSHVFWMALMALMEHCTLWQRITHFLSPRKWVMLHTDLCSFSPVIWYYICTLRMTRV